MASYRYFTTDILTGVEIMDLPLYGVNMNKHMSQAGNFTGTFLLGTGVYNDSHLLEGSTPGLLALNVVRNDELIWSGPLWSRTYGANGKYCQLTAQTWESCFDHIVFEEHVIQQKVEQVTLLQNLINQMQTQPSCNFGLTYTPPAATGIVRTILLPNYEFHFVIDAISQIVGADDGLEYTIDSNKTVRVGYPTLEQASDNAFDYPGTIANYWWPESAASGAIKFAAVGVIPYGKQANQVIRAVAVDGNKLAAGYPAWWQVRSYPTVGDNDLITAKARQGLIDYGMPVVVPTFQLDNSDLFTSWNKLGDLFQVTIYDSRFPNGMTASRRLVGWDLTPQSSESDESLQFVIDGEDL